MRKLKPLDAYDVCPRASFCIHANEAVVCNIMVCHVRKAAFKLGEKIPPLTRLQEWKRYHKERREANLDGRHTWIYCRGCHTDLVGTNSMVSDTVDAYGKNHVRYKCLVCGFEADYDFDSAPIPMRNDEAVITYGQVQIEEWEIDEPEEQTVDTSTALPALCTEPRSTSVKITPLEDRVIIKATASEAVSKGGIIIPQQAQEKTFFGTVIAIGDSEDIVVKVGDRVMYDKYAGTLIQVDGEDHIIVNHPDILAIVE